MSLDFFTDPKMLAPARTIRPDLRDGAFVLRSPDWLRRYDRCVGEWLERWAAETPNADAFAEPVACGRFMLSWGALRRRVGAVAQALLNLGLSAERPIVILSDNSLGSWRIPAHRST